MGLIGEAEMEDATDSGMSHRRTMLLPHMPLREPHMCPFLY